VWASLWNFQAVEQRMWHGIPEENVRMGILVTPAFLAEAANGVALTGSPTDPLDARYFVTVQPGEASVVRPNPGDVPEVDLVAAAADGTFGVERGRPTNLLPLGQFVMSEAELIELGRILKSLAASYEPPPPFPRELIRLDVEFKVSPERAIAVKQVRPYCVPGTAKFVGMLAGRSYTFPNRELVNVAAGSLSVFDELAQRKVLSLSASTLAVSLIDETVKVPWAQEIRGFPGTESYLPSGDAEIKRELDFRNWPDGLVDFRWSFLQAMATPSGDALELRCDRTRLRLNLWEPRETALTGQPLVGAFRDERLAADFVPIAGSPYPIHRLAIELPGGDRIDILTSAPSAQEVTDAVVVGARGRIRGTSFFIDDPFKLAIGDGPRPIRNAYLALAGAEGLAALLVEFRLGVAEPAVVILDATLAPVEELPIAGWSRRLFSLADNPRFRRGDANGDGAIDMADAVMLLMHLFRSTEGISCWDAADANDDGLLNVSDAILLLRHAYGTPVFDGQCGFDETADELSRCEYDLWRCVEE
jgi:hypothetical protein